MQLKVLDGEFCICKLEDIDVKDLSRMEYCFFAKTDEELSLVCKSSDVPSVAKRVDSSWHGMRIVGQLDFSLVGILSKIASILASENVAIYAVSTFDTDYIFVKDYNFERAVAILKKSGYDIENLL